MCIPSSILQISWIYFSDLRLSGFFSFVKKKEKLQKKKSVKAASLKFALNADLRQTSSAMNCNRTLALKAFFI